MDLIKRMRYLEADRKMSAIVNYNNASYGVSGEAAAKVTGVP